MCRYLLDLTDALDIVLVVDASRDVGTSNFGDMRAFLVHFV